MKRTIEDFKRRAQKEVTSKETDNTYVIRKISNVEFIRARLHGFVAPSGSTEPPPKLTADDAKSIDRIGCDSMQFVLENAVVEPRLFFGPEAELPEGAVHVSWISEDEGFLFDEILEFSGINRANREALEAHLKNEPRSEA